MTRFLTLLGLCLLLNMPAHARCVGTNILDTLVGDQRAEFETAADAFTNGIGRYWEVTKNGKRSVLIGTYHLPDPRTATLSAAMTREIEAATSLFVEVTRAEETRMQTAIQSNPEQVLNLSGPRLKDVLSETEWTTLAARAKAVGIPQVSVNIMKPWFVGLSLAMPPCALATAKTGALGLDKLIEAKAQASGVSVTGLETFEELFALFSEGDFEKQLSDLKIGLAMTPSSGDEFETMIQLYLRDEIGKIWVMTDWKLRKAIGKEAAKVALTEAFDVLIARRNTNWLDTLLPALETGNAVVAVGALHLGSDAGLLAILEGEGYAIKRLSLAP